MVWFIILLNGYKNSHKASVDLSQSRIFKALNIACAEKSAICFNKEAWKNII